MRIVAVLAVGVFLGACRPAQTPAPMTERTFAADTGRIVTADGQPENLRVCQRISRHDARWTPTQGEIEVLDPVLIELIEYRLMEGDLTYEDAGSIEPTGYYRDYFGLTRNDQRFILVCGQYGSAPMYIRDGGPLRFTALYDATRRTFVWFEFGYRA